MLYEIPDLKAVQFQNFLKEEKIPFTMASADNQKYFKFLISNFVKKEQKAKIDKFLENF